MNLYLTCNTMDRKDSRQELNTKDEVLKKANKEELVSRPEKGQGEKRDAIQSKETQDDRKEKIDDSDFDQDVCKLLRKIGEGTLISLFVKERVTMEIFVELNHADLRELGVSTFGQRHKILKAIKEYREKREKKQKKTLCKLHPFNTTCPGRKRKSHHQTSYGHQCNITKKMKAKIPKELPVVTSTASSIQPSASVITTASSCQTTVTQSCHTLNVSTTTSALHNNRSSITVPTTLPTTNLAITHGTTSTVTTTKMPKTTHGATVPTSNIATSTNGSASTLPIINTPIIRNGTSTVPVTSMAITTNGTTSTVTSTYTAITTCGSTSTVPTTKLTSIIGTLPTAFPAISSTLSSSSVATPICSAAIFSQVTSSSSNQVPSFSITSTSSSQVVTTSSIGSIAVSSLVTPTSNILSTVSTSSTITSNCAVTVPVNNVLATPNTITDEENNFLRYYLLAQLGTHALRFLFNSFVPPVTLTSHLKKEQAKLKKRCNPQQLTVLYPGNKYRISHNL
ncbi:mucin-2-like [Saccostrea cucullata]|uniref:mucin-2-like n=1 Tax=Saccostrea cuccullata TaxID=36930 RepID=UPI002ED505D9